MPTQETQTIDNSYGILDVIRDVCEDISELPFGHGMRSYANLRTRRGIFENEKKFPRAYLYPFTITDKFNVVGGLVQEYECMLDFLVDCKISESQELIEKKMYEMFLLSSQFIYKLNSDIRVASIDSIQREPNYHVFDENLCGYIVRFNITLTDYYCED